MNAHRPAESLAMWTEATNVARAKRSRLWARFLDVAPETTHAEVRALLAELAQVEELLEAILERVWRFSTMQAFLDGEQAEAERRQKRLRGDARSSESPQTH